MTTVADALVATIYDLIGEKGFRWDRSIARYRDKASGRLVSEKWLLKRAESYTENYVVPQLQRHTERFIAGKIDLATWQERVALELKDGYIVELQLGRGGKAATTFADYGRIGGRLNFEYRRLDNFAREIDLGLLSDAQIEARVKLYANGTRTAYFDGMTEAKIEAKYDLEMRILTPAEHCIECVAAAGYWAPIGSLPAIGTLQCLHNCKCYKTFKRSKDD